MSRTPMVVYGDTKCDDIQQHMHLRDPLLHDITRTRCIP